MRLMAINRRQEFDKYWGDFDNVNMLLYVGLTLDPRYKMRYLDFSLETMYAHDFTKAVGLKLNVKSVLIHMYDAYVKIEEGHNYCRQ